MSDVDPLTQIETAVRAVLEAGVPSATRVLGPEDVGAGRPIPTRFSSACLIVDIGDEDLTHIGREQGGTSALQERRVQVDVMVVVDDAAKDFSVKSRTMANQVRAAMAAAGTLGLPLDDLILVGVKGQTFATEKGVGAGFHLAYRATFISGEATPHRFEPLNDSSELV